MKRIRISLHSSYHSLKLIKTHILDKITHTLSVRWDVVPEMHRRGNDSVDGGGVSPLGHTPPLVFEVVLPSNLNSLSPNCTQLNQLDESDSVTCHIPMVILFNKQYLQVNY